MANPVIVVSPGQIVSQGDWETLSHQHGDTSGQPSLRAATKPEMTAAALAQDEDAAFQDRPIYRYNLADGSYVEARTSPDGQGYQIIDYKPSQRFTASHPASGTSAGGSNTYIGTNPKSGKPSQVTEYPDGRPPTYDDTQVPASAATQNIAVSTEGTPDTSKPGGWDNTRPRKVTRAVNPDGSLGRVVSSIELSGPELTAWRAEQQANQGTSGESRTDVPNRPGWTKITRKTAQGGNATETTAYVGPDGVEVPTLPAEKKETSQPIERNGKTYTEHVVTEGTGTRKYYTDPSGKEVELPAQVKPGEIVKGGGKNGEDVQAVVGADGKTIEYQPIAGAQVPTGRRPLPPGMPPLDTSSPEAAHQSYLAQVAWAQRQQQAGTMTSAEANDLLTPSYHAAQSVIDEAQQKFTNSTAVRTQDQNERRDNINETASRRSSADAGFDGLFRDINANAAHLGRGNGGLAADAFREALYNRQAYAAQAGGYRDEPATAVSPAVQAARTTTVHPDGTVQVTHPIPAPDAQSNAAPMPTAASPEGQALMATNEANRQQYEAAHATPPAVQGEPSPALNQGQDLSTPPSGGQPVNPAVGEPGNDPTKPVGQLPPYMDAARTAQAPPFDPNTSQTVARLRASGMPEDEIQQLIAEHHAEFAAA